MILRFSLLVLLLAGSNCALAQSAQTADNPDCSMRTLEPLLAEFVRAREAAYTRPNASPAMAAADLASAVADLSSALDECGIKQSRPDSLAPPAAKSPGEP